MTEQAKGQAAAHAYGEQTHTHTGRTPGGGVSATASATSTGAGQPTHETSFTSGAVQGWVGGGCYPRSTKPLADPACTPPPASADVPGRGAGAPSFDSMSVHELKEWLTSRGVSLTGAVEKSDLVAIARAQQER